MSAPVLQYGMLLADGWVVKRHISHSPFPPKKVAGLAMDVERFVYGLPCRYYKNQYDSDSSHDDNSSDGKSQAHALIPSVA